MTEQEIRDGKSLGATHRTKARFYHFDQRWGEMACLEKKYKLWECLANKPKGLKPITYLRK